jgi:anti-anti-sigma regulatory factor
MRAAGTIRDVRSLGAHDHVCWAFDEPAEFQAAALHFLLGGLAAGHQVRLVAQATDAEQVLADPDFGRAVVAGAASVVTQGEMYRPDGVVDPVEQCAVYRRDTERALANGYAGLRIAADATPFGRTTESLDAFTRYEHLVDRLMAERPFSAMCAYRRPEVTAAVIERLACAHPVTNVTDAPFHLYAGVDGATALVGELDIASETLFSLALTAAAPPAVDGWIVVDATGLGFVDHRSLLTLSRYARGRQAGVVLRTRRPHLARLVTLLELDNVRVERVA